MKVNPNCNFLCETELISMGDGLVRINLVAQLWFQYIKNVSLFHKTPFFALFYTSGYVCIYYSYSDNVRAFI